MRSVTPIYQIQGTGHVSALDGQTVSTTGVVTAVDSNGFYIQDPNGDGNAATSDGIFVFTSSAPTVVVGQERDGDRHGRRIRPERRRAARLPVDHRDRQPDASVRCSALGAAIAPVRDRRRRQSRAADQRHQRRAPPSSRRSRACWSRSTTPIAVGPTNQQSARSSRSSTTTTTPPMASTPPASRPRHAPVHAGHARARRSGHRRHDSLRTTNTIGGDFNPERIQIDDDSGVLAGFVVARRQSGRAG